ncbi:MAG: nitrile hydratase subunit beta [Dehalococcoidia bacterium]
MNGIHDLGGMHGFGPVLREENEPVFHADWEKTIWAIQRGAGANRVYNTDEFRYSIERMNPAEYLATSYYEHWLAGIERLLVEKGVLTQAELEERTELYRDRPETPRPEREDPALVERLLRRAPARLDPARAGRDAALRRR